MKYLNRANITFVSLVVLVVSLFSVEYVKTLPTLGMVGLLGVTFVKKPTGFRIDKSKLWLISYVLVFLFYLVDGFECRSRQGQTEGQQHGRAQVPARRRHLPVPNSPPAFAHALIAPVASCFYSGQPSSGFAFPPSSLGPRMLARPQRFICQTG